MAKITTADCKKALAALRPDIPEKAWKRTAKLKARGATHPDRPLPAGIGADDPAILRKFTAETDDAWFDGRVLEVGGRIVHAMVVDQDEEDFTYANWDETVATVDLKPSDFCFTSLMKPPSMGGGLEVTICPISYFRKEGYAWDQHLRPYVEGMLPDWLDEVMESCFNLERGVDRSAEDIHAAMSSIGFASLPYDAHVIESYGGEKAYDDEPVSSEADMDPLRRALAPWDESVPSDSLKPSDFLFFVGRSDPADGERIGVRLCPSSYFRQSLQGWEGSLMPYVGDWVPEYLTDKGWEGGGRFLLREGVEKTVEEIRADMKRRFFVEAAAFGRVCFPYNR